MDRSERIESGAWNILTTQWNLPPTSLLAFHVLEQNTGNISSAELAARVNAKMNETEDDDV